MSEANITYAPQVVGTGGLLLSFDYRPLRNSGSDSLQYARFECEQFDWWTQQFPRYITGTGELKLDPHLEGFEQFTVPDWDGEGADPVDKADLDYARTLLKQVAAQLPFEPDAAAGSDGSICMDWISDTSAGSKKIFIDVAPRGKVLTYLRLGNSKPLEKHFKKNDPTLIVYLRHLFEFFNMT
jgi:hypothetical protein